MEATKRKFIRHSIISKTKNDLNINFQEEWHFFNHRMSLTKFHKYISIPNINISYKEVIYNIENDILFKEFISDENKLIMFDLDGVLLDSKKIHFDSLNIALSQIDNNLIITDKEQESIYEGLPTQKKLEILTNIKKLNPNLHEEIWKNKQKYSLEMFSNLKKDEELILKIIHLQTSLKKSF